MRVKVNESGNEVIQKEGDDDSKANGLWSKVMKNIEWNKGRLNHSMR